MNKKPGTAGSVVTPLEPIEALPADLADPGAGAIGPRPSGEDPVAESEQVVGMAYGEEKASRSCGAKAVHVLP